VPTVRRLVPWALLAFVVIGEIAWIQREGDFTGYLTVGELALSGRDIYRESPPGINTWPPLFSLLCIPLALLARPTPYLARGVWLALNFLLLWTSLKMLAQLVHQRTLRLWPDANALSFASPEILLPAILCYRFVLSNFDHLQVNIVIFTGALAGLYWHAHGDDWRGGAALGLASALKVMPVVFVPYFIYRRCYRMALASAAATTLFSLSPILVYGWPRFVDYVGAWRQAIAVGWGVGKMNQSVFAMLDRYIGHGITPWHAPAVIVLPESGNPIVTLASGAALIAITVAALWLFRGNTAPDSPAAIAEYGVVFIVSALFGPLAWKAYLVVLLVPCTLLVGLLRQGILSTADRRRVIGALSAFFVLGGLTAPGMVGKRLADTLEMLSFTTLATLIVLVTLLCMRPKLTRQ